jgi:WD40 repeat protein
MSEIAAHSDRVTAGDVSPDGRLVITGSRNGTLKLWDVQTQALMQHTDLESEICACFFLLDGESLVTATTDGHLRLYNAPELDFSTELATGLTVHSAALAPTGEQLALGCGDGRVHFVAIDGTAEVPLLVRVTQTERRTASPLQRLLGRSKLTSAWVCKCPLCRQTFELSKGTPGQPAPCPHCRRKLRVGAVAVAAQT